MNTVSNTNANATIPAPRNRETGFYGFTYEYAQQLWPLAIRAVAAASDGLFDGARTFLEGGLGRSFAEAVYLTISAEVDAEEALRQVIRRWFKNPCC
jgi:hypothetical protein